MLRKETQTISPVNITYAGRASPSGGGMSVLSLRGTEYISVTAASIGGTAWSAGVLTLKVSNRQEGPFMALPSSITITSAAPVSTVVDVRGYGYAVLDVTTAESNVVLDIAVCMYAAA